MSERTVWHVGYRDGWTLAALAERVKQLDAVLVDVRRSAGPPQSAWSAARFAEALGERYRWLPALGNRNYRDPAAPIVLADEVKGMQQLQRLLRRHVVVVMCACADYESCHRRVVIGKLRRHFGRLAVKALERPDPQGRLW